MADGMKKNAQVVEAQWEDYKVEVSFVIIPGIKKAITKDKSITRFFHKTHAFVEEWFDKCPRINSYMFYPFVFSYGCLLWYFFSTNPFGA